MVATIGNNLQRTMAGNNGAVEWFLMFGDATAVIAERYADAQRRNR
jgi:hypothetical protein